jgi:hypothetical protein
MEMPRKLRRPLIVLAVAGVGLAGINGANNREDRERAPVLEAEAGDVNKDPGSKRLGCKLVLEAAGVNFKLRAAITEGTPPPHSQLTYRNKYQGSGLFADSFRTEPTAVPWQSEQPIPGVHGELDLASSVSGFIGQTPCRPAIVGEE